MGLTNHTRPISYHIMPLVINALGADTERQTDRHTHEFTNKNDFKKPGVYGLRLYVSGLTL